MTVTEKCLNMKIGERWLDTNRAGDKTYVIQKINPDSKMVTIKLDHDIGHWSAGTVLDLPFYSFRDDHRVQESYENEHVDALLSHQRLEVKRLEEIIDEKVKEQEALNRAITKLRSARVLALRMLEAGEKAQEDSDWI